LIACHAINIAMTVVFPAPVASFSNAEQFGIGVGVQRPQPIQFRAGATSQPYRRLAASIWQKNSRRPVGIPPMAEKLRGHRRDRACLLRRRQAPPRAYLRAQFVDVVVGLRLAVFGVKFQQTLADMLMPWRRDRHNVFAAAPSIRPGTDGNACVVPNAVWERQMDYSRLDCRWSAQPQLITVLP
jgi:hypothetical protein